MKLFISSIPERGMDLAIDPKHAWVAEAIAIAFPSENPVVEAFTGQIKVRRSDLIISIDGGMDLPLNPVCDRCMEPFLCTLKIPIRMDLSPLYHSKREKERARNMEEEVELTKEDVDFCFYDGPEIDLRHILAELLVLSLPTGFLCTPTCKGLCPHCGQNLNVKSCFCRSSDPVDPRWEALKKLTLS